jgi:nitrite reductase (NADH) small subunit
MSSAERRWFRVTRREDIPVRQGRLVEFPHLQVAVFNLGDRFLAVENRCSHRGGPLADGIVSGTTVACPLHGWKYDLVTGSVIDHLESHACLQTFPVRVEDGIVCVEVPVVRNSPQTESSACPHRDLPLRWVQRKPLVPSADLSE